MTSDSILGPGLCGGFGGGATAAETMVAQQAQALKEIRSHLSTVDAKPFVTDPFENAVISGDKRTAAVIAAILERNGL